MFGNNPFNEHRAAQEVQEVSKGKLDQYIKGAEKDKIKKYAQSDMGKVSKDDAHKNQEKRNKGIDMAKSKMKPAKVASESVSESKFVIPEEIPANEKNAFMGAAAAAHKAGKSHFNFGGKKHKVTMSGDTAKSINSDTQQEAVVDTHKSADKKPENYTDADGKIRTRMVATKRKKKASDGQQEGDINMNPKAEGSKAEQKESRIRRALMDVLTEGDRAKHYKGATKPETMDDKLKGKGAKDMVNQPKEVDDTEYKGHKDASDAGKVTKPAKQRNGGDQVRSGDQKAIPSATPLKGIMAAYKSMEK
tara:strand:+ start:205 stop:1119 length:915 start_codon:yes stop_codon:yes gene_type:complete